MTKPKGYVVGINNVVLYLYGDGQFQTKTRVESMGNTIETIDYFVEDNYFLYAYQCFEKPWI